MALDGLRVLALETRHANEMARLIERQGGVPTVVASLREAPPEQWEETKKVIERLLGGEFDVGVFLTGVGVRSLVRLVEERMGLRELLMEALRRMRLLARGPKAVAALRSLGLVVDAVAPPPYTWREVVEAARRLHPWSLIVQEYGRSNPALLRGLRSLGAEVTPLRVYEWTLPEDVGPLQDAVRGVVAGDFQVVAFTTPVQVVHLFEVAGQLGLGELLAESLKRCVIGSIGPATTEMLGEYGLEPDIEPQESKMGVLVWELGQRAVGLWEQKRGSSA